MTTTNIMMARIVLKSCSFTSTAICAPMAAPTKAIPESFQEKEVTFIPLLRNPKIDTMLCTRMGILLVPLATAEGSPNHINTGNVMSEPPPASVLIAPMIKPNIKRSKTVYQCSSMGANVNKTIMRLVLLGKTKKGFTEPKNVLYLHPLWRNGRVVECGSLENC